MNLRLNEPWMLLALLAIPAVMIWRRRRGEVPLWLVPYSAAWMKDAPRRWSRDMLWVYAAIALTCIAAAQPQRLDQRVDVSSRGYDLILAIDLSTSMLSEDYTGADGPVNRLEAVRPIIQAFMSGRPHDRIGIVVFAARAYTLAALTLDHDWLARQVAQIRIGEIENGTAIGEGLGMSLMQLERPLDRADAARVGAFVVLLTDGSNNSGVLTPPQAGAIAAHRHVPVYAIGAGRNGMVPYPLFERGRRIGTQQQPSDLDEETLRRLAQQTGGRYFSAGDSNAVQAAFSAIDAAKKTQTQTRTYQRTSELYPWTVLAALACLMVPLLSLQSQSRSGLARV